MPFSTEALDVFSKLSTELDRQRLTVVVLGLQSQFLMSEREAEIKQRTQLLHFEVSYFVELRRSNILQSTVWTSISNPTG